MPSNLPPKLAWIFPRPNPLLSNSMTQVIRKKVNNLDCTAVLGLIFQVMLKFMKFGDDDDEQKLDARVIIILSLKFVASTVDLG
jgi:hypothetical protein